MVQWACNGDLSILLASRVLNFLNSPFYLRLPIDALLNDAWTLSECAQNAVAVTEESLALAAVLLVVRKQNMLVEAKYAVLFVVWVWTWVLMLVGVDVYVYL